MACALLPHINEVMGSIPGLEPFFLSVWSLHGLHGSLFQILRLSPTQLIIGFYKLPVGVNLLPLSMHRDKRQLIQGVTPPSSNDYWNGLLLTPVTLSSGTNRYRRFMNKYLYVIYVYVFLL